MMKSIRMNIMIKQSFDGIITFVSWIVFSAAICKAAVPSMEVPGDCDYTPQDPNSNRFPKDYSFGGSSMSFIIHEQPRTDESNTRRITYACQFGFHFDCEVDRCFTTDPNEEVEPWIYTTATVLCEDGMWTVEGSDDDDWPTCYGWHVLCTPTDKDYCTDITYETYWPFFFFGIAPPWVNTNHLWTRDVDSLIKRVLTLDVGCSGNGIQFFIHYNGGYNYHLEITNTNNLQAFYRTAESDALDFFKFEIARHGNVEPTKMGLSVSKWREMEFKQGNEYKVLVYYSGDTPISDAFNGQWYFRDRLLLATNPQLDRFTEIWRTEYFTMQLNNVPTLGGWGEWGGESPCDVICGEGVKRRTRVCDNPPPTNCGSGCIGNDTDSVPCSMTPCPIDGGWSEWLEWGACSETCGDNSIRTRIVTCTNPPPQYGGIDCPARTTTDEEHCTGLIECDGDGNWAQWTQWVCSATCGDGVKSRNRTCTDPAPWGEGANCLGWDVTVNFYQQHSCASDIPCPVHGQWSEWLPWSECTALCGGGGSRSRIRTCSDPAPDYGGSDCVGDMSELDELCADGPCNIDGNWAQWADWTPCSETCGFGRRTRTRSCTDPTPKGTGKDCAGSLLLVNYYQDDPCMEILNCPVDGNWTSWTEWSNCTVPCGGGSITRTRTCTNPTPAYGGSDCEGNDTQTIHGCNSEECGINGNWGEWTAWLAPCTVTCGGGTKTRKRSCDNPAPTYGGKPCKGSGVNTKACATKRCEDGSWTSWSMWSVCSHSCKGGVQARGRSCTNPRPGPTGHDCPATDPYTQWQRCNQQPCPINGRWAQWTEWSDCPVSCGGGFRVRTRNCSNPAAQWGGKECKGTSVKQKHCNTHVCPLKGTAHNVAFTSTYKNITVTWDVPLEYDWPINYYNVHIRERLSHNKTMATLLHSKGESGYHYNMYDLDSFKTYASRDNKTFEMTLRLLKPFTEYELCMTTKYNHVINSEHTQVKIVKTDKIPWPAPPDPVTIEYADVKKEREYKVLIRWTESKWANYSEPAQYRVMIRDVLHPRLPPEGWVTLATVGTEITGYLLLESSEINLQENAYILQVIASNSYGDSDRAACKDVINYRLVDIDISSWIQLTPYEVVQSACVTYFNNQPDPDGLPRCPDITRDNPDAARLSSGQATILNLSTCLLVFIFCTVATLYRSALC